MSISVTFSIISNTVNPDDMTKILGLSPDNSVVKGEERKPPRTMPRSHGWYLKVEKDSKNLSSVISSLIEKVQPLLAVMSGVRELDPDIVIKFTISIREKVEETSLIIGHDAIKVVSDFNADIDIDFFEKL